MEKYTLITGATSGIGMELAKLFARDGHNLVIVSSNERHLAKAKQLLSEFNVKVITITKDLFDPWAAQELYAEVKGMNIRIDNLVNDAGQGIYGEFVATDIERELKIINLNICSLVVLTKCFLQDMVVKGEGRILNLSSVASKSPGPYQSVYHGTKAFVQSFTEAVRNEVKDKGITVTALLPGATDTDFFNKADMQQSKIAQDKSQLADPADVAKDGYEALKAGKDMVVSGFKNKVQVAMSGILPDSVTADQVRKQQEPVNKPRRTSL